MKDETFVKHYKNIYPKSYSFLVEEFIAAGKKQATLTKRLNKEKE